MKLVVTCEHRFSRTPDGVVWTNAAFCHSFWQRYLSVFEEVSILARVCEATAASPDWARVTGPGVSVFPLPGYSGIWAFLTRYREMERLAREAVGPADAVLLKTPSHFAHLISNRMIRERRPFGLEVCGDPDGVFAPHVTAHPLRPIIRYWSIRTLRRQCESAAAVAYVTEHFLQNKYPAFSYTADISDVEAPGFGEEDQSRNGWSISAPSVEIPDVSTCLLHTPRPLDGRRAVVVSVGSMEQLYKGFDVLIEALAICRREGADVCLELVGDGRFRVNLESLAAKCGVSSFVRFHGALSGPDKILPLLQQADLFVLASRTEGLPRAMVEAMAIGLPCIGTSVGGIPELLTPPNLVPSGDPVLLAQAISSALSDPTRRKAMGAANREQSQRFSPVLLRGKREMFYRQLLHSTERYLQSKHGVFVESQFQ
ncbi:MAG: glycosyltransferase [Bryobacteraceae bacterium]|nr:glycosyltransferase [Bryobacteraceae bacterium]